MNSKIKSKLALNSRLLFLLPYAIITIFFIILPIVLIVSNAFKKVDNNFDSWAIIKQISTWKIIVRSLRIGTLSAILCLLIGFPYAYYISIHNSKILRIYGLSFILSPMLIFTIAKIYAIRGFFLSIFEENSLNAEWFMVLALTYLNLPYMIMPLYSVFKDMPKNIVEASQDLGYNHIKTLFKVIVPYGFKAIISGLGLIFLSSATTFVISKQLLPNGSQLQMIGEIINNYTNASNPYDLSLGTSLVLVVSFVFIGMYLIITFLPKIIIKLVQGGK